MIGFARKGGLSPAQRGLGGLILKQYGEEEYNTGGKNFLFSSERG